MGLEAAAITAVVALGAEAGIAISGTVAGVIVSAGTTALLVGGSLALSAALAPEIPSAKAAKTAKQQQALEGGPRYRIRGRAMLGGTILFAAAKGNDLYRVVAYCQGPVTAIEEFYVNQKLVGVDSAGRILTAPFFRDDTSSWAWINTRPGVEDQAVLPLTNAAFPARWAATARGRGLVLAESRFRSPGSQSAKHPKVYPGGYPTVQIVALAEPIFDPRVPGASFGDSASWVWSDNGVLNLLDHLTCARERGGWAMPVEWFDIEDIARAADEADLSVPTRTGTEPRSRCWGVQDLGPTISLADTLSAMLLSTGTTLAVTQAGLLTIRLIDDAPDPTVAIAWRDIVSLDLAGRSAVDDRPNRFTTTYYAPERRYEVVQADLTGLRWAAYQDEIDRVGEITSSIDLPWCPSAAQAGRIARRVAALRRSPTATVTTNLAGLSAMGHVEAAVEIEPLGEVLNASISSVRLEGLGAEAPISIALVETPVLPTWDPLLDEPSPPPEMVDVADGSDVAAPTVTAGALISRDGGATWYLRFAVGYTAGDQEKQQIMWRERIGRTYTAWVPIERAGGWSSYGGTITREVGPLVGRDGAEVIASSVPDLQSVSDWSARAIFSRPVPTAPAQPVLGVGNGGPPPPTIARSSLNAVRIDVFTSTGAFVVSLPTDATGAIDASAYTSGYILLAYDSFGTSSPPLTT